MSTGICPPLFLVGFSGQSWQRDLSLWGTVRRVGRVGGPGKGVQGASPSPSSRAGSGGVRLGLAGPRGAKAGLDRRKGQMTAASGLWWARSPAPLACCADKLPRGCAAQVRDPGPSRETWGWGRGPRLRGSRWRCGWRMNEGRPWAPETAQRPLCRGECARPACLAPGALVGV